MIKSFPLDHIDPSPFQTRPLDSVRVKNRAAEIEAQGLLQPPVGRIHPEHTDRVQLAFGHHRHAAYVLLAQKDPTRWGEMPIDVRELNDRALFDAAIVENAGRDDLTAIETARAMQKYMEQFGVKQVELIPIFNLDQSSISNLLSLLELPDAIQEMVDEGTLPQRHARALRAPARVNAQQAITIARKVAKADESERDEKMSGELYSFIREHAADLSDNDSWKFSWTPNEATVVAVKARYPVMFNGIGDPPACNGCPSFTRHERRAYCLTPACRAAKNHCWAIVETERVAKEKKLTLITLGEKVEMILDGAYRQEEFAQKALKAKDNSLRLVPFVPKENDYGYTRKSVLGSNFVALGTTDLDALKKSVGKLPKSQSEREQAKASTESREMREERAEEMRDLERAQRLVASAAPYLCKWLPTHKTLLDMLLDAYDPTLVLHIKTEQKKAGDARVPLMQTFLTEYFHLGDEWNWDADDESSAQVRKSLLKLAGELRVKLPLGWDAEPSDAAQAKAKEGVDKEIKDCLTDCPSSDINFTSNLAEANAATIKAALKELDPKHNKTACAKLQARLRQLEKEQKGKAKK